MKQISGIAITAIAGILALSSTSAQAGTLIYTFTGTDGDIGESSRDFTPDGGGPTLTVTGFKDISDSNLGNLNISGSGVGVDGPPPLAITGGDPGNVAGGILNNEALELEFAASGQYTLVSVTYAGVPNGERGVSLSVNGGAAIDETVPGLPLPLDAGTIDYDVSGSSFLFTGDNFRIASAEFEHIPEPLTILGTGLALMSMPIMKKARQKR